MARFKDLALDTDDQATSVEFWAAALGLDAELRDPGEPQPLRGSVAEETVWVNVVPEPKRGKTRAHLDVHAASVEELTSLGAEVIDEQPHWTVVRASDGIEFCVFVRKTVPAYRLFGLVVDCVDAPAQARWWAERLGGTAAENVPGGGWWAITDAAMPFEGMVFVGVPEPRQGKNRLHWDVWGSVEEFTAAGATVVLARGEDRDWDVLADPEGNEFCVFADD